MSVLINKILEELLSVKDEHGRVYHETTVRAWHGNRPFKCTFLHCSFRRQGFQLKSERRSHEKYHDKPWKCSFPDCEYAEGGFLSRKMRDVHLSRFHQKLNNETTKLEKPDVDEIQPLLFDLIGADEVEAVKELLPIIWDLDYTVRIVIWERAATSGSPEMLELAISTEGIDFQRSYLIWSIQGRNVDCFKLLLSRTGTHMPESILNYIFKSNSQEILDAFELFLDTCLDLPSMFSSRPYINRQFRQGIKLTARVPQREQILLKYFKKRNFIKGNESWAFNSLLIDVALTTCSIKFASYLIDQGADVNFRSGKTKNPTPLQYAARSCSHESAEMMKFLLIKGADPEVLYKHGKICDEKGAKGIEKWLGVTWDDLVAQTKKEREQAGSENTGDD